MQASVKTRVGIMRGGQGENYTSSLKRGGEIISYLLENLSDKYKPVDILIDKEGLWHLGGMPIKPANLVHKVDIVWNTAHPSLSMILDNLSIPNIGVGSFSHTLENSKEMLREHMNKMNVSMPRHILIPAYFADIDARPQTPERSDGGQGPRERYAIKKAKEVHAKFASPWIVKSFTPDANMAIHLAKTFDELVAGIEDGVNHNKSILVEEFIPGTVASLHSVPHFRNEEIYIFPPVNVFGSLSAENKNKLSLLVKDLHHHLGAKHYLKSNFLLNKRGKIFLLDFESVPNLKSHSHFSQACESVGAKMHHVVEHILEQTGVWCNGNIHDSGS